RGEPADRCPPFLTLALPQERSYELGVSDGRHGGHMTGSTVVRRVSLAVFALLPGLAIAQSTTPFPAAHENPPARWTGPVFTVSQDYPATKPPPEVGAWKTIDYKTKPAEYLKAVLDYCYEGNIDVDFRGQDNAIRKWYHTPWLQAGNKGREFVHGMTRER